MIKCLVDSENSQVILRNVVKEDAIFLMELNNDLEIAKYVVGNPKQVNMEEQLQWMEKIKAEIQTKRFIIENHGIAVGTIIISDIDSINATANLNIKICREARAKGIGKKSIRAALQYCFESLNMFCVTARVLPYNNASVALFKSSGFVMEGILKSRVVKNGIRYDLLSFSITKDKFILQKH